jgi:hypothetical protein
MAEKLYLTDGPEHINLVTKYGQRQIFGIFSGGREQNWRRREKRMMESIYGQERKTMNEGRVELGCEGERRRVEASGATC